MLRFMISVLSVEVLVQFLLYFLASVNYFKHFIRVRVKLAF